MRFSRAQFCNGIFEVRWFGRFLRGIIAEPSQYPLAIVYRGGIVNRVYKFEKIYTSVYSVLVRGQYPSRGVYQQRSKPCVYRDGEFSSGYRVKTHIGSKKMGAIENGLGGYTQSTLLSNCWE